MLKIVNTGELYKIVSHDVRITDIIVEPDFYRFNFRHEAYPTKDFDYHLQRDSLYSFDATNYLYKGWLHYGNNNSIYSINKNSLLATCNFLDFLSDSVHDWDFVTNK
jgi:hypothetical protein